MKKLSKNRMRGAKFFCRQLFLAARISPDGEFYAFGADMETNSRSAKERYAVSLFRYRVSLGAKGSQYHRA
jgi:hypothetical protein